MEVTPWFAPPVDAIVILVSKRIPIVTPLVTIRLKRAFAIAEAEYRKAVNVLRHPPYSNLVRSPTSARQVPHVSVACVSAIAVKDWLNKAVLV